MTMVAQHASQLGMTECNQKPGHHLQSPGPACGAVGLHYVVELHHVRWHLSSVFTCSLLAALVSC